MKFKLHRMGIDTHLESVAFLDEEVGADDSLGIRPMDRLEIRADGRSVLAVVNFVEGDVVPEGVIGLSNTPFARLGLAEGAPVEVQPAAPPISVGRVRAKMRGEKLSDNDLLDIIRDVVNRRYTKVELTAFVVAATIHRLDDDEISALVRAMVETGGQLRWPDAIVVDKHSIGGIPGNRTTPIVTALVAAAGLTMPKTSSRAVTSAAGTADTLEALMDVNIPIEAIQHIVAQEKACMTWGGALNLAPADDLLIRVEHPLDIDSEDLMIASILAKKKAAGSTHVLLDVPIGPDAKVHSAREAAALKARFERIGASLGMHVRVRTTDGSHPIGRGVGPALEARDVMQVLMNDPSAPGDLREKSLVLAGDILEMAGMSAPGDGATLARELLTEGDAYTKFERIRELQGRREPPPPGAHTHEHRATHTGRLVHLGNKEIARLAKLAGAPRRMGAGVDLLKGVGDCVEENDIILRIHAETEASLEFATRYLEAAPPARIE